jgi:5-formyltetrahydrofolate cyclo-ligase
MPKRSIRDDLLARRQHLAADTCLGRSLEAQQRFLLTPEFAAATVVGLYSPVRNEVFTEELFTVARRSGKMVAYPRVRGVLLEFVRVMERQELVPGAFGILEPGGTQVVPLAALDLVVVPGVAFDLTGHRLGYGKGYYDRFLHERRGQLVGLCFDFQLVGTLPAEAHDVRMDMVVTDERTLRFADVGTGSNEQSNINQVRRARLWE